jgi:hypothetical protein
MLKSLATILKKKPSETTPPPTAPVPPPPAAPAPPPEEHPVLRDEHIPIYQSLAMSDEMREALFPTNPRMVSAIFERPASSTPPPQAAPAANGQALARETGMFPIV